VKLFKVKGIVIKEVQYKENDKIITIMTDKLGKISCMAKGAKKNNSSLLAISQLFVYSEFLLYKGTNFYHINSAEMIESFYKLRLDYDKLEKVFEVSKLLNKLAYEEDEESEILSLFLNTIYIIDNKDKPFDLVRNTFLLKLLCLLGYAPRLYKCSCCNAKMFNDNNKKETKYYYDRTNNSAVCEECYNKAINNNKLEIRKYKQIGESALYCLLYVIASDTKKIFNFEIKGKTLDEFSDFVNEYYLSQII